MARRLTASEEFENDQRFIDEYARAHPIESLIQSIRETSTIADAIGFTYTQRGHKFYVLTFPTGGLTLVYDIAQGLWHERQSYGQTRWNPAADRWQVVAKPGGLPLGP